MTTCPPLTARAPNDPFLTKDNLYELIVDTYDRSPGTSVSVSCADGITLVGPSRVTCLVTGSWDYQAKPHCTVATTEPVANETDTSASIIVGVVCAVAGVIIVVLAVMLFVVYRRDRKLRQSQKSTRSMLTLSGYGREPPAPYDKHYEKPSDNLPRDADKLPRPQGGRRFESELELESQLSNSMYLPRGPGDNWRDYLSSDSRTMFYTGINRPHVKQWVSKGTGYPNNRMMSEFSDEVPYRRDPLLWRNAVLY